MIRSALNVVFNARGIFLREVCLAAIPSNRLRRQQKQELRLIAACAAEISAANVLRLVHEISSGNRIRKIRAAR